MNPQQDMNHIYCHYVSHMGNIITSVCLDKHCKNNNRLCCVLCIENFHNYHLDKIIKVDDLIAFIQKESENQIQAFEPQSEGKQQMVQDLEQLHTQISILQQIIIEKIKTIKSQTLHYYLKENYQIYKQQLTLEKEIQQWNLFLKNILYYVEVDKNKIQLIASNEDEIRSDQHYKKIISQSTQSLQFLINQINHNIHLLKPVSNLRFPLMPDILKDSGEKITQIKVSQDGSILASASQDKYIQLWNTQTKQKIQKLGLKQQCGNKEERCYLEGKIYKMRFSSNNQYFAYAAGIQLILCDLSQSVEFELATHIQNAISDLQFSKDTQFLVSGDHAPYLRIYSVTTKTQIFTLKMNSIRKIIISQNNHLISYVGDTKINVWNFQTKKLQIQSKHYHKYSVKTLVSSADFSMLYSNDMDCIHIWRLFGQRKLTLIRKIDCTVTSILQTLIANQNLYFKFKLLQFKLQYSIIF